MSLIPYISYFKRPESPAARPVPPLQSNTYHFVSDEGITDDTIYGYQGCVSRIDVGPSTEKLAEKGVASLSKLLSLFENDIVFSSPELTNVEKCKELAEKTEHFLKLSSILFEADSDEAKTIEECREALKFYPHALETAPHAYEKGASEDLLKIKNFLK